MMIRADDDEDDDGEIAPPDNNDVLRRVPGARGHGGMRVP